MEAGNELVGIPLQSSIDGILKDSNFIEDDNVPDWILKFLQAVVSQDEIAQTRFYENKSEGDVYGLVQSFDSFLEVELDDKGEILMIDFVKIYVQATIIWMGSTYEVISYKQTS